MKKLLIAGLAFATLVGCTKTNYIDQQTRGIASVVGAPATLTVNSQLVQGQITLDQFQHQLMVEVTITDTTHLDLIFTVNGYAFREKYIDLTQPGTYDLSSENDFIQYKSH